MAETSRQILGIRFHAGDLATLLDRTAQGGLIVVPSAPVLVDLDRDPAHRAALERSDLAITDSGFMVLLWRLFRGERLERISGLKYLRALMDQSDFRPPGATFWIMPSAEDARANLIWLARQGIEVPPVNIHVAPFYSAGTLSDPGLLAAIEAQRPKYIIIALGGGVQERLGYYLRQHLSAFGSDAPRRPLWEQRDPCAPAQGEIAAEAPPRQAGPETAPPIASGRFDGLKAPSQPNPPTLGPSAIRHPSSGHPPSGLGRPAIICTGAAIAFLSGRQANIPVWADRLMLGWLFRTLSNPARFVPRYWKALRLVPLLWRHGPRSCG